MEEAGTAIDEAIAHLDSLIARLQQPSGSAPSANPPSGTTLAPPQEPSFKADEGHQEEAGEYKGPKDGSSDLNFVNAVPKVFEGRKRPLKLPGGAGGKPSMGSASEHTENFDKAQIQVGLVQTVSNHPVSEKLYVCKVEVAPGEIRQVVAGLRHFVKAGELESRKVCVVLNLKPAKLAGQVSEAMILAGSIPTAEGSEIVKVLQPPIVASVGDRICLEGRAPGASPAKQLSSKIWEKIVPLLKVEGGLAKFDGQCLKTSVGAITVPGLPDGAGIH